MINVDETNALNYLRMRPVHVSGWPQFDDAELAAATVKQLAWGVSNIVLRVDTGLRSFVLKQSRKQLRTPIAWFSQLERIWREVDALHLLSERLPSHVVPRVLFEDSDNYLFGMEAVDADHRVWKADLLAGQLDNGIAIRLGQLLSQVHGCTPHTEDLSTGLDDRSVFEELRLDPFYRYVAANTSSRELAAALEQLVAETLECRECLVLGDFSPKNILLTSSGPVMVDFETAHIGDPAFDIGFFLSHLVLKAFYHGATSSDVLPLAQTFWETYQSSRSPAVNLTAVNPTTGLDFEGRCVRHLAACMLARVDGKSRVDYLQEPWQIDGVRNVCRTLLVPDHQSETQSMEFCFLTTARFLCR